MKRRFVQIDGQLIEVDLNYQQPLRDSGSMIMPDIKPYKSPVTGEIIAGRKQHREHLKIHDLVEVGNEYPEPKPPPDMPSPREELRRHFYK